MILYGRNPVREALRAGRRRLGPVWAVPRAAQAPWLEGVDVHVASDADIARRCGSEDHQGICAEAGGYPYSGEAELLAVPEPFLVVLDQLQDPQNLGAICRTAECAGVTGVVISERRSVPVTAAAVKASAGALEHLRVARVRNVADFVLAAKARGCWCYGASAEGTVAYDDPDYRGGVVLVLGAEGAGLRPRVAASCDALVALPLRGRVESLNVSAAAAVLIYEVLRRRDP